MLDGCSTCKWCKGCEGCPVVPNREQPRRTLSLNTFAALPLPGCSFALLVVRIRGTQQTRCSEPSTTAKNSFLKDPSRPCRCQDAVSRSSWFESGHPTDPLFRTEYDREELF